MSAQTIQVGETTAGPGGDVPAGEPVELPVEEILTGRAFATGKSGSGKSNTGGVICEQLLDREHSLLIVDIEGEYYSLKENYEVLHVGADEEVDLRVGPEHAEKIASLALEQHVPVILDVSGYIDEDVRDELVYQVVRHLFAKEKTARKPFLLLVEEIQEYLPESGGDSNLGKMLVRVAKRGRKRGLGILGASQRPANVKKDFITQCDWLVWHRFTWSNDTKVVSDVLSAEHADAVEDLVPGEAFLQADFLEPEIRRMQWRRKETFDAGATPTLDDVERPELKSISGDLVDELEEISEAAEQREDEVEQLRERVDELEDDLDEKDERIERLLDLREMVDSTEGFGPSSGETVTVEFDGTAFEVPEVIQAEVLEVREEKREIEDELDEVRADRDRLQERVDELEDELDDREAPEELRALRDDLHELVMDRHPDLFDTDDQLTELKELVQQKQAQIDELEQRRPDALDIDADLLSNDIVREYVDAVAAKAQYSDDNVWDVVIALSSLAAGKTAKVREVEKQMELAEKTVLAILNHLAENRVAEKTKDGRANAYALDREALRDQVKTADQQAAINARREEIRSNGGGDGD